MIVRSSAAQGTIKGFVLLSEIDKVAVKFGTGSKENCFEKRVFFPKNTEIIGVFAKFKVV